MAEIVLSIEEGVGTGNNWPPSKYARKLEAQENFSPALEKCFGRSLKLLDIV